MTLNVLDIIDNANYHDNICVHLIDCFLIYDCHPSLAVVGLLIVFISVRVKSLLLLLQLYSIRILLARGPMLVAQSNSRFKETSLNVGASKDVLSRYIESICYVACRLGLQVAFHPFRRSDSGEG